MARGFSLATQMLREDVNKWRAERIAKDLPLLARRYIHMRDVVILTGPKVLKVSSWRGTLADVTGWSPGAYTFD